MNQKFNMRLKEAMNIRAITQSELCEKTGIPKSAMSQYISGNFKPKQNRTHSLAKALNVNEAWLMGYDVPMGRQTIEEQESQNENTVAIKMSISTRIKEARIRKGLTQEELAKKIGVTKGAIANYENQVSVPKVNIMYKLFEALDCDANFLYQDEMNNINKSELLQLTLLEQFSKREINHIKNYRKLNILGKDSADTYINDISKIPKYTIKDDDIAEKTIELLYFDVPVSAGLGQPLDESTATYLSVKNKYVPPNASYILRVSGDSMEPTYTDGDKIFVAHKQVNDGEIGIFSINGDAYVKELEKDGLISHNRKYKKIKFHEGDTIFCMGSVLGKCEDFYLLNYESAVKNTIPYQSAAYGNGELNGELTPDENIEGIKAIRNIKNKKSGK